MIEKNYIAQLRFYTYFYHGLDKLVNWDHNYVTFYCCLVLSNICLIYIEVSIYLWTITQYTVKVWLWGIYCQFPLPKAQVYFQREVLCHVRPTLGNWEESGPIMWKNRIFSPDSSWFHQTRFISRSYRIGATALFILTLIFRRCKIIKFLSTCHTFIIFHCHWCDSDSQWKSVVIAASRLLFFVWYVNIFSRYQHKL